MPRTKSKSSGNKPLPANQQKGKKVCTCCHDDKNLTDFYYSSSLMYSLDERIPVCKECCKTSVLAGNPKRERQLYISEYKIVCSL